MENAMLFEHNTIPKRINVSSHKFSIGRGLDNSYVVEDLSVSRRHSILEFLKDQWYLYDMSANGTWLNERLIVKNGSHRLTDGDIIKLSDTCMYTFKIIPPDGQFSQEEIVNATEAVIASVEAFNTEFNVLYADAPIRTESTVVPASDEQPVTLELPTINHPCTNLPVSRSSSSQEASSSTKLSKCNVEFVEDELQCSICTEMLVKAVTLTCSHTFCSYCITQWQKSKGNCPICRTKITTKCPTLILDNYIEKIMKTASEEFKTHRQEIVAQRQTSVMLQGSSTSVPDVASVAAPSIIDISSEEDDDIDDDPDYEEGNSYDEDYSYECDYYSTPEPYFGGYGSCFICGSKSHWSNGCLFNMNR